jgi:hypothetical protein
MKGIYHIKMALETSEKSILDALNNPSGYYSQIFDNSKILLGRPLKDQ